MANITKKYKKDKQLIDNVDVKFNEVVEARNGYSTLGKRLDNVNSQLIKITN